MKTASPLTGNHVAKQLKVFLRSNGIPYALCNSSIVVTGGKLKPCIFNFQNSYIHVRMVEDFQFTYSFPCESIHQLLAKLLRFQIINEQQLTRLALK